MTCCSGNVDATDVARNTLAVLELAGRTDIEVAIGRPTPLVRALEITPETHGPQGIGHAELPPPSRAVSDRHGVDVIVETARRPARRDDPGDARAPDEPGHRAPPRAGAAAPAPPAGCSWAAASGSPATRPRARSGTSTATPRPRGSRSPRSARGGDPARRPLALGLDVTERLADRARPSRRARPPGGQPARRFARPGPRRGPDACHPQRRVEPDRALPRRCAAVLHGVPRPLRRLLRRPHPRRARARGRARPEPRAHGGAHRRRRDGRPHHDRRDRGRLPRTGGAGRPNCDVAVSADSAAFLDRFIERVGALAERTAAARRAARLANAAGA